MEIEYLERLLKMKSGLPTLRQAAKARGYKGYDCKVTVVPPRFMEVVGLGETTTYKVKLWGLNKKHALEMNGIS